MRMQSSSACCQLTHTCLNFAVQSKDDKVDALETTVESEKEGEGDKEKEEAVAAGVVVLCDFYVSLFQLFSCLSSICGVIGYVLCWIGLCVCQGLCVVRRRERVIRGWRRLVPQVCDWS